MCIYLKFTYAGLLRIRNTLLWMKHMDVTLSTTYKTLHSGILIFLSRIIFQISLCSWADKALDNLGLICVFISACSTREWSLWTQGPCPSSFWWLTTYNSVKCLADGKHSIIVCPHPCMFLETFYKFHVQVINKHQNIFNEWIRENDLDISPDVTETVAHLILMTTLWVGFLQEALNHEANVWNKLTSNWN